MQFSRKSKSLRFLLSSNSWLLNPTDSVAVESHIQYERPKLSIETSKRLLQHLDLTHNIVLNLILIHHRPLSIDINSSIKEVVNFAQKKERARDSTDSNLLLQVTFFVLPAGIFLDYHVYKITDVERTD